MKLLLKMSAFVVLLSSTTLVHACLECGSIPVTGLTIQASRENSSAFENIMRINVSSGTCQGVIYAYLKNDHPAYSGILSVLLAAQATDKNIFVVVKESGGIGTGAKEIEWVSR